MTIQGPGAGSLTISGGGAIRVFNIRAQSAVVTISGLTITGGDAKAAQTSGGNQGGDIFNSAGGATRADGQTPGLTLLDDVIQNGSATGTLQDPVARGGGIFNAGGSTATGATLILDGTTVQNNLAQGLNDQGPLGLGEGGGIFNDLGASVALIDGSQIIGNTAQGGAATAGNTDLTGTTAPNGVNPGDPGTSGSGGGAGADGRGGGIYNAGTVLVDGLSGPIAFGPLVLNATGGQIVFSGNAALGGNGGGSKTWRRGRRRHHRGRGQRRRRH